MIFTLSTTKYYYPDKNQREKFEKLGFTFDLLDKPDSFFYDSYTINGKPTIEINTIEELIELSKTYGELIISDDKCIEIYNDDRE